jgi:hypothetical protein
MAPASLAFEGRMPDRFPAGFRLNQQSRPWPCLCMWCVRESCPRICGHTSADMSAPADQSAAPRRHSSHAAKPEQGVHPLFLAHDRRVPRLEGIWHRTCSDSLATATCSTAPAARRRLAGRPASCPDRRGVGRGRGRREEREAHGSPHPTSLVACRPREMRVERAIEGLGDRAREAEARCTQSTSRRHGLKR